MSVQQKLELARQELLDMGLRGNPLLNVQKNRKYLEIVEERSGDVFRILVEDRKSMSFLPLPEELEPEDADGDPETKAQPLPSLVDYLDAKVGDNRFQDRYLQTRLPAEKLDTSLLRIESEAHTLLQEQGIDVLYLALGFLEWYEDANARTPRYAPLVLVPVELTRESARSRFTISYTEADLGPNLTLAAKLSGEFRVELPKFDDEFDISSYLAQVSKAVEGQAQWKVHENRIGLGLFSFGKFQMYIDLDAQSWPENAPLAENPQLVKLFEEGFEKDAGLLEQVEDHEYLRAPESLHLVKDADSSQLEAVLAVMEGANLVIQGPPGTGKSQTITNLISEALARGKKVLFVAQKMAALEVVKARLDECHLGDAVLELHSHKSNKKAVLDSLKRVFEQGSPQSPDRSAEYRRLKEVREYLDGYVEDIRTPILNSGLNYIECLGRMLELQRDERIQSLARIPFRLLKDWGQEDLARARRALEAVQDHLVEFGPPEDNPFSQSALMSLSPSEEQDLARLVARARTILGELETSAADLAGAMKLPTPESFSDIDVLYRAGKRALEAPHLSGVRVSTQEWQIRRDEVREALECGAEMTRIRDKFSNVFIDAAFDADLLSIRMGLAGRADKWWRPFSGAYRRAKATLRGYIQDKLTGKPTEWLAWVDEMLSYQQHRDRFKELEPICRTLFGAQWQGAGSDWDVLQRIATWIIELYEEIGNGELPEGLADFLEGDPDISAWSSQTEQLSDRASLLQGLLTELLHALAWKTGPEEEDRGLREWRRLLDGWDNTAELYAMTRFNQIAKDLDSARLGTIVEEVRTWRDAPRVLVDRLLLSYYSGLVDFAYSGCPRISRFDRLSHERLIREFGDLDQSAFAFSQERLVGHLHDGLPPLNAPGEMDTLRREFSKKRRHLPIRRLMSEAGNVIQQAKPVFMMSPMSVATYLPQGSVEFDLVIFDEASQIPAPEALGAIMRGSQAVVVGDSKQMPPTNFFSKAVEISDEDAEESATADVESILGLMLARGTPERMLRWHYRSRHHSLIAVSNDQFYENRLLIFPSPGVNLHAWGLRFHHLPDTHYDRGGSRTNLGEARAVAQAVLAHARETPQLSLGVVAFSTAQREAVLLEVERLRREHPETEEFFKHHDGGDEFFIKNLENVQGDERDVIFISIGYGRTVAGNLGQNFGPLNGSGGERRLNVLISRARLAMDVFANFTADDLRVEAGSPFGVKALKAFLHYAQTGDLPQSQETEREPDSPFEREVMQAIQELGYEVEPQMGCQGFYIDLAIRDPDKPGVYALAVECDGASYHSSAIARDRDRLRQSVLEGLGWRFHRIWSTEWFRNQKAEIERLEGAIKAALVVRPSQAAGDSTSSASPKHSGPQIARVNGEDERVPAIPVYAPVGPAILGLPSGVTDFLDIDDRLIEAAIRRVVEAEGPVHRQILIGRLVDAVGLQRAGSRIQKKIGECLHILKRGGYVILQGDFTVASDTPGKAPLRDWSVLPQSHRKFDFVPDAELAHAVFVTIKDAYSIDAEACMSAAVGLLGFKRLTSAIKGRVESVIERLADGGIVDISSERLQLHDVARAAAEFETLWLRCTVQAVQSRASA